MATWCQTCSGFPHKAGFPAAAPTTVVSEYVQGLVLLLLGWVVCCCLKTCLAHCSPSSLVGADMIMMIFSNEKQCSVWCLSISARTQFWNVSFPGLWLVTITEVSGLPRVGHSPILQRLSNFTKIQGEIRHMCWFNRIFVFRLNLRWTLPHRSVSLSSTSCTCPPPWRSPVTSGG